MALSVQGIRQQLQAVLDGGASAEAFEDWLVQQSWDMHQWAPREVQKLVARLEVWFAEYSSGHLSDSQLHGEWRKLMERLQAPPAKAFSVVMHGQAGEIVSMDTSTAVGRVMPSMDVHTRSRCGWQPTAMMAPSRSRDAVIVLGRQPLPTA